MILFQYRVDSKDNIYPTNVYAETLDSSLVKWISFINEPDRIGAENEELKMLVKDFGPTVIKKLDNEGSYYFVLTAAMTHKTVYINEVKIDVDFIADLKYKTTDEGGRKTPVFSGYRPHIKFPFSESMTSGEQIFLDKDTVFPGDCVRAQIRILDHTTFKNALEKGMSFEFREGSRVIGTGEIVSVQNVVLRKP